MIVLVAGTGTDVGKTFVTAAVVRALQARCVAVAARKPVQSFAPQDSRTDADALATASGEDPHTVCASHRWYPRAMAPPMAADALGLPPFTIADLKHELAPPADRVTFVETAGGVRSPLANDGDTVDLADALRPELVVLVADAGLGTISLVRLSAQALRHHQVVVYLNRFDARDNLHTRNRVWLEDRERLAVVTDIDALAHRLALRAVR